MPLRHATPNRTPIARPALARRAARAVAFVLALAAALPAAAACSGATPTAVAQSFYRSHYLFWDQAPQRLGDAVAAPLLALLRSEHACRDGGELCAIDADPWLGAQDGEAVDPRFQAEGRDRVRVAYRFELGEERSERSAQLLFVHERGCWRIADLISPDGGSLRRSLAQFHRP